MELIINHKEAEELALIKQEESNLARAYLDLLKVKKSAMPDCNKCSDYDKLKADYDDKSKRIRIYRAALIEACNGDSLSVSELYQKHAELRDTPRSVSVSKFWLCCVEVKHAT